MASLDELPVELLHRIFDNLNAENILFSVQYVCKRFNVITKTYNRYKLNFKSIFKHKFHQLCHATCPKNVLSLTLSDGDQTPGQIGLFLSSNRIEEYTRLQSVTLLSIEEPYLTIILQHLSTTCSLVSLEIHCEFNTVLSRETLQLLSLIIAQNSLSKLDVTFGYQTIDRLKWPEKSSIQYLRIFNSIGLNTFCTILRCSPYLKTMVLRECIINDMKAFESILSQNTSYPQLTSLTLTDCDSEMQMIELFLSLTPSLIHLTVIGDGSDLFDGARWEQFIQTKLPDLTKFEFAFQKNIGINCDAADFNSFIAPFQTSFWLQNKRWFVAALGIKNSPFMNLYTLPDCAQKINFNSQASKISRSTAPVMIKDLITMDRVTEVTLDLMEMQTDMIEKVEVNSIVFISENPFLLFSEIFVYRKKYQLIDYLTNSPNLYFDLMAIGRVVHLNFFHHSSIFQLLLILCLMSILQTVIVLIKQPVLLLYSNKLLIFNP